MTVSKTISDLVSNPVVIAIVAAFTTLYTSTVGPELPYYVKDLFNNSVFRFIVILLVAYLASAQKPIVAIVAAVSFMLITSYLSEDAVVERFAGKRQRN